MYDEVRSRREGLDGSLMRLYQTMKILRSPSGCPWDRIQTEKSATESMLDESYEYLDAVLDKDVDHMKEEIGDVLINLMMNLIIAEESGTFPPADAVNDASDKLIRRHPHVFGEKHVEKAEDVLPIWESVKKNVEGRVSEDAFFSSVPKSLPPLEESYEVQKKINTHQYDKEDNGYRKHSAKAFHRIGESRPADLLELTERRHKEIGLLGSLLLCCGFVVLISHFFSLLRLFMDGMRFAELAVLLKLDTIGIVLLIFVSIVISLLALRACKSDLITARAFSHVSLRLYLQSKIAPLTRRCYIMLSDTKTIVN